MLTTLASLVTVGAITLYGAGGQAQPPMHGRTLRLNISATGQQVVGTTYIETDAVSRDGRPFGLDVLTCPGAAQPNVTVARCTVDFGLEGGTLQASLEQNNSTGAVAGVIDGGTGRYARASGRITGEGSDNGASLVLRLRQP